MRGLVIKSTGSSYIVRLDDGSDAECHIKGNFRIRGIRSTNPVAVGDYVQVSLIEEGSPTPQRSDFTGEVGLIGWITDVEERRNYIVRRSTNLSKESHIIASNLDQVALIVTINHPVTSTTFIDRFLATAEAYRVPAVLIFNKIDLLTPQELLRLDELRTLYESLGYQTVAISAKNLSAKDGLSTILTGKTTLLSGNSGVGKSTLLNAMFGKEIARTGHISDAHNKGMHTTTFSEMFPYHGGWIIDTPGIKGFGAIDMKKEEVGHYFREIFQIGQQCRFGNCTHTNEPGCAVKEAVENGEIAWSRYHSYTNIFFDEDEKHRREDY